MEVALVEINDANFCQSHLKEVCEDCNADFREDNDSYYGFDTVDRGAIICPASLDQEGVYKCKKHANSSCTVCFAWKKQIQKLRTAAKKAHAG